MSKQPCWYPVIWPSDHFRKVAKGIYEAYVERISSSVYERGADDTEDLRHAQLAFAKERVKLRHEKAKYNRWIRDTSRQELYWENLHDAVRAHAIEPVLPIAAGSPGRQEGVLFLSDQHYGAEFTIYGLHGEVLNQYSPEIFEQRMGHLLHEVVRLVREYGFSSIKILSCGDSVDGLLRHSQLQQLRWGVVDSAVKYAYYMISWLTELSRHVRIVFHNTAGNHSELRLLDGKKANTSGRTSTRQLWRSSRPHWAATPTSKLSRIPRG